MTHCPFMNFAQNKKRKKEKGIETPNQSPTPEVNEKLSKCFSLNLVGLNFFSFVIA